MRNYIATVCFALAFFFVVLTIGVEIYATRWTSTINDLNYQVQVAPPDVLPFVHLERISIQLAKISSQLDRLTNIILIVVFGLAGLFLRQDRWELISKRTDKDT